MSQETAIETRPCELCKGSGRRTGTNHPCLVCDGIARFPSFDSERILGLILTQGRLTSEIHAMTEDETLNSRAFFVWATIRKLKGVSDPMEQVHAGLAITGDPFRTELETLAGELYTKEVAA